MRSILVRLLAAISRPVPRLTLIRAIATTLLELAGIALIVAGIALISLAAALIAAGAALLLISWRATR
jgi:hypothetical protein